MIRRWMRSLAAGGPVFPLFVLFGLNAVDELDRAAFAILLPEIQESFGLDLQGVLTLVAITALGALALQVPIAAYSDRHRRVPIAVAGAAAWGVFSLLTGLATTVVMLCLVRMGSGIGKAVVDPTHNSLLADYYDVESRPRVYAVHRAANAVGGFIGPLAAGLLAYAFGWRTPFFVFAVPTILLVFLALRLREPVRGAQERKAMGASEAAVLTEEEPPSFAEGWRLVWRIESLRRIWYALPFLAASLIGFVSLAGLLYAQEFNLDERARGFVAAGVEPLQLAGLVIGARVGLRLMAKGPGEVLRFLSLVAFLVSLLSVGFALSPNLAVAVVMNALLTACLAALVPGILASLSLAIPPRARSLGFSVASLWIIPGLIILPIIGAISDRIGIRVGLLVLVPVFLIGGLLLAHAGPVIADDIAQVWRTAAARSEVAYERRQGRSKLLLVRGLNVSYGDVQVLFDVDLEIDEGQIVALLGTNGAGKSTLLKAICGAIVPDRGAVILDGRETTFAPPHEIAALGVMQVPGGRGVFPSLTVAENLDVAGWLHRHDRTLVAEGRAHVLELFPILGQRLDHPAANLSGGQQQMLALGMAFLTRPRLLLIDELSLGLAPVVIEQLLPVITELRDRGTTVILVEQSVNVALTIASTAYFMEKGEIRFTGPTAELLDRGDVLRSVFLEGAAAGMTSSSSSKAPVARQPVTDASGTPRDGTREPVVSRSAAGFAGNGLAPATRGAKGVEGVDAADERSTPLTVRALVRSFGGIRAINDVSLDVTAGEIVGIIGPNGAGKTTLFDLISGFTPVDGGRVLLGGVDVTDRAPFQHALAGLGRSFQDARLFPGLTVEETIAVALEREVDVGDVVSAILHRPALFDSEEQIRRRVEELIELLGLDAFRSKFVRELSTGSRRVVDLACVVAHRPTVVLLDEPSSGIAQRETEALAPLLRRIREGLGTALVVVEHDMPLVTSVADRLIAMDQGRIIAEGVPTDVLHDPTVVASYLGTDQRVVARSGALSTKGDTDATER